MAISKYTKQEYLNYIQFSKKNHLLVEGVTDKRIFMLLFDEWKQKNDINAVNLEIDTAERLSFGDVPRNCDRIEQICQSIQNKDYKQRLVGFVDREFREFQYNTSFQDNLERHNVQDRLVWSRGHSIENYFFEYSILREAFRNIVVIECFREALEFFEGLLNSILRIACAVSLASQTIGKLQDIEPKIRLEFFQVINNVIVMNVEDFKLDLSKTKSQFTLEQVEQFGENYIDFQSKIALCQDSQLLRWLCHGHISMKLIWIAYDLCIEQVDSTQINYIKIKEIIKINSLANCWVRKALAGQCVYPKEVFQLFGIDT